MGGFKVVDDVFIVVGCKDKGICGVVVGLIVVLDMVIVFVVGDCVRVVVVD